MVSELNLKQELIDGVKAGGFAGIATAAVLFVIYLGLQILFLMTGESFEFISFLAFTLTIGVGVTALAIIPGVVGSIFYASLREKLYRHDLAFAACLSVIVIGIAVKFGVQFLILFIPTAVYIVALERLYEQR